MTSRRTAACLLVLPVLLAACSDTASEPARDVKQPKADTGSATQDRTGKTKKASAVPTDYLSYPRDAQRVVATVNGRNITLDQVVKHIDSRHFKGFADYLATKAGQYEVHSPRMADWIRQYADIEALRAEARKRGIPATVILKETGAVLPAAVEKFRKQYEEQTGRAFPTEPSSVRALEQGFLKKRGLGLEVEGLLNALVPEELDQLQADEFLKRHNEEVNGILTVAQIFIRNRDPKTGALLEGERKAEMLEKVNEVKRQLEAGANFEEVATKMSEDSTAKKGGRLDNLLRLDPRMPASFCRAAWGIRDRTWTGPVTSRYGLHFIKRIEWTMRRTVLRLDPTNADVRRLVRTQRREDLLFEIRKAHDVTLLY